MKDEDMQLIKSYKDGELGKITFYRSQISASLRDGQQLERLVKETEQVLVALGIGRPTVVNALRQQNAPLYSIIAKTSTHQLLNLFFDFTPTNPTYTKKLDVAGTEGLYIYDSRTDMGFWTNSGVSAQITFAESTEPNCSLWLMIQRSISTNSVVVEEEKE